MVGWLTTIDLSSVRCFLALADEFRNGSKHKESKVRSRSQCRNLDRNKLESYLQDSFASPSSSLGCLEVLDVETLATMASGSLPPTPFLPPVASLLAVS